MKADCTRGLFYANPLQRTFVAVWHHSKFSLRLAQRRRKEHISNEHSFGLQHNMPIGYPEALSSRRMGLSQK